MSELTKKLREKLDKYNGAFFKIEVIDLYTLCDIIDLQRAAIEKYSGIVATYPEFKRVDELEREALEKLKL